MAANNRFFFYFSATIRTQNDIRFNPAVNNKEQSAPAKENQTKRACDASDNDKPNAEQLDEHSATRKLALLYFGSHAAATN